MTKRQITYAVVWGLSLFALLLLSLSREKQLAQAKRVNADLRESLEIQHKTIDELDAAYDNLKYALKVCKSSLK